MVPNPETEANKLMERYVREVGPRLPMTDETRLEISQEVLVTICEVANGTLDPGSAWLIISRADPNFRSTKSTPRPPLRLMITDESDE